MASGSAAQRRWQRNRDLVDQHPRWHGVRHPELLALPPTRFSQLDMLPAIERGRAWPAPHPEVARLLEWEQRAERNRALIAAHPRWRGIRHPERIVFPRSVGESAGLLGYRAAIRHALDRLQESEGVYVQIATVADSIERRRWSWSTNPAAAASAPPRAPSASVRVPVPRLERPRMPLGRPRLTTGRLSV